MKQSAIRHGLSLGLFALAAAILVGLVHGLSGDAILRQRRQAELDALLQVLPPAVHDNDLLDESFILDPTSSSFSDMDLLGLEQPTPAYTARLAGSISALILPARIHDGYGGDIDILVGIRPDGSLSGVRVLEHHETPGLGDKIELRISDWILGFNGRSLQDPPEPRWTVKKDGGDFDQFVGATITPRAVVNGVRNVLVFFHDNKEHLLEQNEQ